MLNIIEDTSKQYIVKSNFNKTKQSWSYKRLNNQNYEMKAEKTISLVRMNKSI